MIVPKYLVGKRVEIRGIVTNGGDLIMLDTYGYRIYIQLKKALARSCDLYPKSIKKLIPCPLHIHLQLFLQPAERLFCQRCWV